MAFVVFQFHRKKITDLRELPAYGRNMSNSRRLVKINTVSATAATENE